MRTFELTELVSDQHLEEAFEGTNFGGSKPADIVAGTLLKIAGRYHTGHTALVCCQELGLVGKNKQSPKLTLKGSRYLYQAYRKTRT